MGKSTREGSSIYDGQHVKNPGPGDYKLAGLIGSKKTMAVMKSYSPRNIGPILQRASLGGPGAGTYDVRQSLKLTHSRIPFGKIGTGLRDSVELNKFPGPGTYKSDQDPFRQTHYKQRTTVFDKKIRDSIAEPTDVPGPGSYISALDLDVDVPVYQKISIKRKYGDRNKIVSPGPVFEVNAPIRKLKLRSPSYRIGTGPKIDVNPQLLNRNPGPG